MHKTFNTNLEKNISTCILTIIKIINFFSELMTSIYHTQISDNYIDFASSVVLTFM